MTMIPHDASEKQEQKSCLHCEQTKPENYENFRPLVGKRVGFQNVCRECMNKQDTERTHKRHQESPPVFDENVLKECFTCHNPYPATPQYFARNKRKIDGLEPTCKVCKSARNKDWRTHNIEREIAIKSSYREKNRETLRAKGRAYVKTHLAEHNARWHRYDARKRQAKGTYTAQEVSEQFDRQKGRCYWCSKKLDKKKRTYHVDHVIPLTRGGSNDISNVVIACPHCNMSRNDRLPHEWPEGGRLL